MWPCLSPFVYFSKDLSLLWLSNKLVISLLNVLFDTNIQALYWPSRNLDLVICGEKGRTTLLCKVLVLLEALTESIPCQILQNSQLFILMGNLIPTPIDRLFVRIFCARGKGSQVKN